MTDNAALRLLTAPASTRWSEAVASAWAVPAVRSGTWGSGLILVGSLTPAFLPEGNALTKLWLLRDLQYGPGRILATGLLLLGVFVLLRAWLRLYSRDDGVDVSRATLGLWSLPLLLAPPLFSSDAYSYAAQGRIVRQGFDPYSVGPGLIGGQFAAQVDPLWLWTPAPYGPLALQIQRVVVDLMGNNPYAAAVGMRLPAIAALVVIVVLLPRVATALGRNARFALWLGVLNPLTVLHLLGGAHNDVIMIAFVVAALWLATQHRLVWAALLVALAAAVKQPAIVAVIAVGVLAAPPPTADRVFAWPWNAWPAPFRSSFRPVWPAWAPRSAWTRVQVLHVAAAAAVALAGFVVITAVSGLGYGWVGAMHVPGEVRTYLAPSTALGSLGEGLLRLTGYPTAAGYAVPALRVTGLVLGAVAVGWIILNRAARQPVTSLVLMLLTIVVCAPSLHPWYILWGGVLLGLTRVDRRTLRIATWLTALFACYGVIDFAVHNGLVAFGVSAGLALLWIATGHDRELVNPSAIPLPAQDGPRVAGPDRAARRWRD